jgi:hypothetical protein
VVWYRVRGAGRVQGGCRQGAGGVQGARYRAIGTRGEGRTARDRCRLSCPPARRCTSRNLRQYAGTPVLVHGVLVLVESVVCRLSVSLPVCVCSGCYCTLYNRLNY